MHNRFVIGMIVILIASVSLPNNITPLSDEENQISFTSSNWASVEISNNSYSSINGPSLVIDSNDFAHAVFVESQTLYHTTNASGQWITTVVDTDSGYTPSVAIDQNDVLHIAYHIDSSTCGCLGYATNAGGSWNSQTIDSMNGIGADATWTDIEVESTGNIVIIYWDDDSVELGLANSNQGAWNYGTLDLTPGPSEDYHPHGGHMGNLILDSNDIPHLVWFDDDLNDMHYTTNKTGTWEDHIFPDYVPNTGDIAIDSNDDIHIIFSKHEWDEDNLSYYNNIGGVWTNYSIDNSIFIDPYNGNTTVKSLAIDQFDNIHIAVVDSQTDSLMYITNSSGNWVSNLVTNSVDVGYQPSLFLDSNEEPHIAYTDFTNKTVLLSYVGQQEADDDQDGVPNSSDQCPNTPAGSTVDANGCAFGESDSDGDGVSDLLDNCQNTPSGESVDIYGCSQSQLDDDNDGVMNDGDQCPNTPSGETANAVGCSQSQLDDDGDGIVNSIDQCPNTPSGETVNAVGCSQSQLDDDGDGVMNDGDQCPNTPSGETVNAVGCGQSQLDDDGDGVVNSIDQCPNTPFNVNVNPQGCNLPPTCDISYQNSTGFVSNQAEELGMLNGNTSVNIELLPETYVFTIVCNDPEGDQITMLVSIDGGNPSNFTGSPVNSGPITIPVHAGMLLSKTLSFTWSDDMNSGSYTMEITLSGDDYSSSWIPGFELWLAISAIILSIYWRKRY